MVFLLGSPEPAGYRVSLQSPSKVPGEQTGLKVPASLRFLHSLFPF